MIRRELTIARLAVAEGVGHLAGTRIDGGEIDLMVAVTMSFRWRGRR